MGQGFSLCNVLNPAHTPAVAQRREVHRGVIVQRDDERALPNSVITGISIVLSCELNKQLPNKASQPQVGGIRATLQSWMVLCKAYQDNCDTLRSVMKE
jgi:hypothetical protein